MIKGMKHSEETKKKMRMSHLGRKYKPMSEEGKRNLSEAQKKVWLNSEHRKKMSEVHKGQIGWNKGKKGLQVAWNKGKTGYLNSKARKKMSEAHKGKSSWNKGKSPSEETIKKQRATLKKTYLSNPELRKRISETTKKAMSNSKLRKKLSDSLKGNIPWNKGKRGIYTQEQLRKLSESHKRTYLNPEARKRVSEFFRGKTPWIKGKHHSKEGIDKRLETIKERYGKLVAWNKGIPMREESRKKLSETQKANPPSLETRGKMSESRKKYFEEFPEAKKRIGKFHKKRYEKFPENKEFSRKTILRMYESGDFPKQTNTKPERQIKEELIKRRYKEGIDFIHQFKFMDKFMCDFCFPKQKIVVEVDGDFWHANPNKYPTGSFLHPHQIKGIGRDKSKSAYIKKADNGSWTLIRFWESDIQKDVAKCVDKIEEVLEEKE